MKKLAFLGLLLVFSNICLPYSQAQDAAAQDKTGQQLLDEAEELKLKAETIVQKKAVIELLEKALAKGLDESNTKFAKQLLVDALFSRAERLISQGARFGIGAGVREEATAHLKRAIEVDPTFIDGYMMLAGLSMNPRRGAANTEALEWMNKAVAAAEAKEDAKEKLAAALFRRSMLQTKEEDKLADLERAHKADEKSIDVLMQLAQYAFQKGDAEKANGYLYKIVELKPDNMGAAETLSNSLLKLGKIEDAKTLGAKIVENQPNSFLGYYIRAKAIDRQAADLRDESKNEEQKKLYEAAATDYTAAIDKAPADQPNLKLQFQIERAEAFLSCDKLAESRADVKAVLNAAPGLPQAMLVRSFLSAREKKFDAAIDDLKEVIDSLSDQADTTGLQLQLASYYVADKRPRKGVEIITSLIDEGIEGDELKSSALRARADAYLAFGKHTDAIKDYEEALTIDPADSGILNNLAWVLATSPDDKIRNGEKSIEFGLKACELTQYKQSHILSTLAAGYAEKGDFETAMKWAAKAVELGVGSENHEQLKQELESYKQKKPWREKQETEEKKGQKSEDRDL
jgi:tetratricopeptide (TPR) repeat protein